MGCSLLQSVTQRAEAGSMVVRGCLKARPGLFQRPAESPGGGAAAAGEDDVWAALVAVAQRVAHLFERACLDSAKSTTDVLAINELSQSRTLATFSDAVWDAAGLDREKIFTLGLAGLKACCSPCVRLCGWLLCGWLPVWLVAFVAAYRSTCCPSARFSYFLLPPTP